MSKKETRQVGISKLTRSETVTVRLDPKIKYMAELASRKQRRTLSSFIEWTIEENLSRVEIFRNLNTNKSVSVADEIPKLWDGYEADRFCKLAKYYPGLLTHIEDQLWKLIKDIKIPYTDKDNKEQTLQLMLDNEPIYPIIRAVWPSLGKYISGDLEYQDLKQIMITTFNTLDDWQKQPSPDVDDDDDVVNEEDNWD